MAGIDDWMAVARADDDDEVRERILTGYRGGKPFTPYVPTIALPSPLDRVLDFGCGLGRNFPYLNTIARSVSGFDLPPMIARCRALPAQPVDLLSDDWALVSSGRFDLIYAALVLQHVEPDAARSYVGDFARLSPGVYLLTRVESDFGENVLELFASSGLFDGGECVEVEHDPATHQLRAIGRAPFDEVRQLPSGGHYEVLLRSRLWRDAADGRMAREASNRDA